MLKQSPAPVAVMQFAAIDDTVKKVQMLKQSPAPATVMPFAAIDDTVKKEAPIAIDAHVAEKAMIKVTQAGPPVLVASHERGEPRFRRDRGGKVEATKGQTSHFVPLSARCERITYEELRKCFHLPIIDAAERMGICATLLRKVVRKFNVKRWPHRQIQKIDTCVSHLRSAAKDAQSEDQRAMLLAQSDALVNMREAVLDDPNSTHLMVPAGALKQGEQEGKKYHAQPMPFSTGSLLPFSTGSLLPAHPGVAWISIHCDHNRRKIENLMNLLYYTILYYTGTYSTYGTRVVYYAAYYKALHNTQYSAQ
jgi:hypothetical protein